MRKREEYSALSTLIRLTFDDALGDFAHGSLDLLLHIDGRHLDDDVGHDFETWLPKLTDPNWHSRLSWRRSCLSGKREHRPCPGIAEACPSLLALTQRRLSVPRIDEGDAEICEMSGIAGGEGCFARGGDTGDLDIADLDRSADLPLPGGDDSRGCRSKPVKRQRAAVEDFASQFRPVRIFLKCELAHIS